MPVTPPLSYPGVYVQEIPSGVRTITGVPTSITAFLGRASRGPVNEPVTIFGYGDYESTFGGLHPDSTMSYAVRDFFMNGGGQAIVVRLFQAKPEDSDAAPDTPPTVAPASDQLQQASAAIENAVEELGNLEGDDPQAARLKIQEAIRTALAAITAAETAAGQEAARAVANKKLEEAQAAFNDDQTPEAAAALAEALKALNEATAVPAAGPIAADGTAKTEDEFLVAASPGSWGNALKVKFSAVENEDVLDKYELAQGELFSLEIFEGDARTPSETIHNVSIKESKRRIDRVLPQESGLVRVGAYTEDFAPPEEALSLAGGADSEPLEIATYEGSADDKTGLYALEKADLFNILCVPPDSRDGDIDPSLNGVFAAYCVERRAIYIVDPPHSWAANKETAANTAKKQFQDNVLQISGEASRNAALYFPRVVQADPLREGQPDVFPACGVIAGVLARTDATRGVWKAPAGLDASLNGIRGLQANLSDAENGILNPLGVNVLRTFPNLGSVIWGARTLRGADQLGDEYKYLPVRRLALFIEETLYRSTQWAVFEPNDEPLWAQLRLNIGVFMHDLFRQGAFQGAKPSDAYFVHCDSSTTTQSDIDKGIVNIIVGFAPLKPAEFVIIYLQQIAGNLAT